MGEVGASTQPRLHFSRGTLLDIPGANFFMCRQYKLVSFYFWIYILLFFVMLVIADITCNDSAYYSVVTSNPAHGEVYSIQPQY
jgi:hypothetical protein